MRRLWILLICCMGVWGCGADDEFEQPSLGTAEQAVGVLPGEFGVILNGSGGPQNRCNHWDVNYTKCYIPEVKTFIYRTEYNSPTAWYDITMEEAILVMRTYMEPRGWEFYPIGGFVNYIVRYLSAGVHLSPGKLAQTTVTVSPFCSGLCYGTGRETLVDISRVEEMCTACGWAVGSQKCRKAFRKVIMHEIMHASGLGHSSENETDIMSVSLGGTASFCANIPNARPTGWELEMLRMYDPDN